jgi:hypothetical protein
MAAQPSASKYIAFISYAREDEAFAQQLERAIETSRRAKDEPARRVFRDRSDFTGNEYTTWVRHHLQESTNLIVVCSPAARASKAVNEEIEFFAAEHGRERIFPVLKAGVPNNEVEDCRAFPEALLQGHAAIPLASDFRTRSEANPNLRAGDLESEWYKLLANVVGRDADEIRASEERLELREQRRKIYYLLAALILIFLFLGVMFALWRRARVAEDRAVRAEAAAKDMSRKAETELAEVKRPSVELPATPALLPRIYFHIRNESQRARAQAVANALPSSSWIVPGIQRLDVGPSTSELRYFRNDEGAEAQRIVAALRQQGVAVTAKEVPGYETSDKIRPNHFELWLAPNAP